MKKSFWPGLLVTVLTLTVIAAAGYYGWTWYDNNVDRSGWAQEEGKIFYKDFHGKPVTGWLEIDGSRYCFGADTQLLTGWQDIDGERYFLGADGAMRTGWQEIAGTRYYLDADGTLHTGWLEQTEGIYYLTEEGTPHFGWLELENGNYYFGDTGTMHTGWLEQADGLYYFDADGTTVSGQMILEEKTYYFLESGAMHTGWLEGEDSVRYYHADGTLATGWQEIGQKKYFFNSDGTMHTGWLEQGEYDYYLQEDGSAAVGPTQIGEYTYYFTPAGIHLVLVNANIPVPEYYEPDLVTWSGVHKVDASCYEALKRMLEDCVAAGNGYTFNSGYRSVAEQRYLLNLRTSEYQAQGYSYDEAYAISRSSVALPGTSEHHLGLAVDILGADAQVWLQEHCWEYGFILRYLSEKGHITGIIYEPWHYRYVGTEVSMAMKDTGLCLEEYLGAVEIEEAPAEASEG